jgi:hypothetical protein
MSSSPSKATKAKPARTPKFDPCRAPATASAVAEVVEVTNQLLAAEPPRKRARKAADAAMFDTTVAAVVTDLHHGAIAGRDGVSLSRSTAMPDSRYRSAVQNKQLPKILDRMAASPLNLIEQTLGFHTQLGGRLTVVRPSAKMHALFARHALSFADFTRNTSAEEIVLLKDTKLTSAPAALAEYVDTEYTNEYRAEVKRINAHLKAADVDYDEDVGVADFLVDAGDRYLKRHFTRNSFTSGGRLYGGFWLPLGKERRLENTTINGESVVSLDFDAMGVRLAYAAARQLPPERELYPLEFHNGLPRGSTGRKAMKKLVAACQFSLQPITKWPRGAAQGGKGVPVEVAIEAIRKAHPCVAQTFFMGIGHSLQFAESEILIDTLLRLIGRGVTALPVHDCIVVAESDLDTARREMSMAFTFHTNQPAHIKEERAE